MVYVVLLVTGLFVTAIDEDVAKRFRLGKRNGRDCLITPAGDPFLSLGVNHIQNIMQGAFASDKQGACREAHKNLTKWGFNTAGYGTPDPLCRMMPYLSPMYLTKNANYLSDTMFQYPDVFDPIVQRKIKESIQYAVGKQRGNPNLIGYYWTDTPQWDLKRARRKRGTDWVSAIRELPSSAPGKQRYQKFLAEEGASDEAFLRLIARELYRVLGEETRRLAPETLIFGERYLVGDHPDCVIEEALPYIDVLSIQPGGADFDAAYFDELRSKFKKPIMLCDHQSSFSTPNYPKTMWQQMESEEAAGQAYAQFLKAALSKPYVIGFQRCQYIDRFEERVGTLKQGVLKEDGTPYEKLVRHIAEANRDAVKRFAQSTSER